MRSLLRNFLKWLDTRFPERVVVTQTEFLNMKAKLDNLEKVLTEGRLLKIEQEINKFNASMGFAGPSMKGMATQFQR
jgi:hypothetical protein